jgi:hypothetical protein
VKALSSSPSITLNKKEEMVYIVDVLPPVASLGSLVPDRAHSWELRYSVEGLNSK